MPKANTYTTHREKMISGAFASLMHLLFLALLIFGVNWQQKTTPQVNSVDLWSPLAPVPAPRPPVVESPPPPQPEVKPEVQPKPVPPPPKPVPKAEIEKPDIALKAAREKAEKEKVEKEKAQKLEKEKALREKTEKEKAEKEKQDKERRVEETKKRDEAKIRKQQEADALRREREQENAQRAAAAAQQSQMDAIRNAIAARIKRYIVQPPNLQGNPEAEFDVVVAPNGNVLTAKLRRSSGNAAYDSAVERAISGAQPLPMPSDPALLRQLRELKLTFRAQE